MNNFKNHNYIIEKDVTTAEGIKLKFISLSDDKQTVHYSYIYRKNWFKRKIIYGNCSVNIWRSLIQSYIPKIDITLQYVIDKYDFSKNSLFLQHVLSEITRFDVIRYEENAKTFYLDPPELFKKLLNHSDSLYFYNLYMSSYGSFSCYHIYKLIQQQGYDLFHMISLMDCYIMNKFNELPCNIVKDRFCCAIKSINFFKNEVIYTYVAFYDYKESILGEATEHQDVCTLVEWIEGVESNLKQYKNYHYGSKQKIF